MPRWPTANIKVSSLIDRYDDINAARIVREVNSKMKHLDIPLIDNSNITRDHVGRKGLHLNSRGTSSLALNLISMLKKFSE